MIYWQLPFKTKEKVLNIYDENAQGHKLIIDREKIELLIADNDIINRTIIPLNKFEDQEKLEDFFIEFNAVCSVVQEMSN